MIFALHTLAEVEQLAGKIAVLDSGRLLACDTLAGLRATAGADTLEETLEETLEILTRRTASRSRLHSISSNHRQRFGKRRAGPSSDYFSRVPGN